MLIKKDDVAKLLNWHIENGAYLDPDLLIDFMKDVINSDEEYITSEEAIEAKRLHDYIKHVSNKYFEIIKTPSEYSVEIITNMVGKLTSAFGDEILEQCLILKKISEVPGTAERAIGIRPIVVKKKPEKIIYYYYEQCIKCFIEGLIEAASVMARSVLEHALREKLRNNKVAYYAFVKGSDSLNSLIKTCKDHKIISPDLAKKAHDVKNTGNHAIHRHTLDVNEVKRQLELLGEVIEYLYK